jgi:GH15 family glucan-1,4-alpha-glucosidase
MDDLDLAAIGNCTIAALIDRQATIAWMCFPRFDGDPLFSALLDGGVEPAARGGRFAVEMLDCVEIRQAYLDNTSVLVTTFVDKSGAVAELTDFAPRFRRLERIYRPPTIVRRLLPIAGRPRMRIRLRPTFDWGAGRAQITLGSNHMRFVGSSQTVRATTDVPICYLAEERHFVLDRPMSIVLGADEPYGAEIETATREQLDKTVAYWRDWVHSLSIPFDWQEAVIRAAITLKLCSFEETGAIVAALTTSVPEAPGTERNWDYRYCWVRDAYFVIHALNRLGATRTMEQYMRFIGNVVDDWGRDGDLPPLYTITRSGALDETVATTLTGYRGMGPVRVGNAAHTQIQNDTYGAIILASTQLFFDRRLPRPSGPALFERLEALGRRALAVFDQPDAGPWELRSIASVHTFSAAMCWAACDRLARIAREIGLNERSAYWAERAARLHETISARAFNPRLGHFVSTLDGDDLDATLLLLNELDFLRADDPRFAATVDAVGAKLKQGDLLLRYAVADDFGHMSTAFVICAFWYVDALIALGRRDEARAMFEAALERRNSFGLFSEDASLDGRELWGNFPQTYSMVGLINCATRLSRTWEDAL